MEDYDAGVSQEWIDEHVKALVKLRAEHPELMKPMPADPAWQMRCTGSAPGVQPAISGCGRAFFTSVEGKTVCGDCASHTALESARAANGWRPEDTHMAPPFPYYKHDAGK